MRRLQSLVGEAFNLPAEVPVHIDSVVVEGPVLRIGSFLNKRGVVYVDNVLVHGKLDGAPFFVDADQMSFDCRFEFEGDLKESPAYFTGLKENIKIRDVVLSTHAASGTINWSAVKFSPEEAEGVIRRSKWVFKEHVLDYFKGNKAALLEQLNKIIPSVATFLKWDQ